MQLKCIDLEVLLRYIAIFTYINFAFRDRVGKIFICIIIKLHVYLMKFLNYF